MQRGASLSTDVLIWKNNDACLGDKNGVELASEMATWDPVGCLAGEAYETFIKIESAEYPQIFGISGSIYIATPQ